MGTKEGEHRGWGKLQKGAGSVEEETGSHPLQGRDKLLEVTEGEQSESPGDTHQPSSLPDVFIPCTTLSMPT